MSVDPTSTPASAPIALSPVRLADDVNGCGVLRDAGLLDMASLDMALFDAAFLDAVLRDARCSMRCRV